MRASTTGAHNRTNSIMSTIMPPQPRCSYVYRNSLYYTGISEYVRRPTSSKASKAHTKKAKHSQLQSNMQHGVRLLYLFLFVRCCGVVLFRIIVPSHSCFSFIRATGDRQGEHGPLGRVLVTLNLPLGLAATERCIPTRPPILPALYEGDPLPA